MRWMRGSIEEEEREEEGEVEGEEEDFLLKM